MLTKLLKYEWKDNWKIPTILIGILLFISLLTGVTAALSEWWEYENFAIVMMRVSVMLIYYAGIIGVNLGIVIYLAVRFYKSMYTDEGYLTHTLPVTARQLLMAKGIHLAIWYCLTALAGVASYMILGAMIALLNVSLRVDLRYLWLSLCEELSSVPTFYLSNFGFSLLFMTITSILYNVAALMGSISIGQNLAGHKVLGSIGAYFAICVPVFVIMLIIMISITPYMVIQIDGADNNPFFFFALIYWITGAIYAAMSVGLYFISEYMTRKRLNLD